MLDQDLKEQLKTIFSDLTNTIVFKISKSTHVDYEKCVDFLKDVADTNPQKIKMEMDSTENSIAPRFSVYAENSNPKLFFTGIPTGHEFTSLILAILNSDGKGKLPDEKMKSRIASLKGPITLKTYISLTCENCPDVVQMLNQFALIHPHFTHEMIDGAYTQNEIDELGIQGVPSVVHNNKLVHSGKISFLDLLTKLESYFGIDENSKSLSNLPKDLGHFDVTVVGGGPAGVSAAIYSARKGLKTILLAEKMGGQVIETKGIENLISVPYTEGPELVAKMQEHLKQYPITVLEHRRVKTILNPSEKVKRIEIEGGEFLNTNTLIAATGAKWRELNIPGEKEYLGAGVAFCPHCDGPFYKGKKIAVIGGGNSGVEAAIDLAGIVKEVTLIEYGDQLKADQVLVDKLKSLPNSHIITSAQSKVIKGDGKRVNALVYLDRKNQAEQTLELDGIFVQIGLLPNSHFLKGIVELTNFGEIIIDVKGRTSVKGIYAAGDVTNVPYKQIVVAMGEGSKAALSAFEDRMYH